MAKALHLGPWFISENFLSVRKWEPKFVPQEATLTSTAIWIRVPQLPTEFYDQDILKKVGRKLGKLLKIDKCTSSTLRGRYACICIQVPLETPVETSVIIGDHKQAVIYEGEGTLCTICGRIGHTAFSCNYRVQKPTATQEPQDDHEGKAVISEESKWKTVTFPRRRKQGQENTINKNEGKTNKPQHAPQTEEIQVNMFDVNSGKFLQTQTLRYNSKKLLNDQKTKKRPNVRNKKFTSTQDLPKYGHNTGPPMQPNTGAKQKARPTNDDPTNTNHEPSFQGDSSPTPNSSNTMSGETPNGADPSSPNGHSTKATTDSPIPHPNIQTYAFPTKSPEIISNGEIPTVTNSNRVPYLLPLLFPNEKTSTVTSITSPINEHTTPWL
ncbi:PREDICTED: uncharacterized protein LOC109216271 [Nicotiana attenuata]|uniref:uncharacterized protein LOC109216271 n=1 Tax=Nicotiana attenuata TaxID=49451 RepID=UPI000904F65D|nr:PREDICTED: uncharacterized protein LOC109216271 [Nicotiana attenuata]